MKSRTVKAGVLLGAFLLLGVWLVHAHYPLAQGHRDLELIMEILPGQSPEFALTLTNQSGEERVLEFGSGQKFDFLVKQGEEVIWQWSEDMMFTSALESVTLGAGESITFTAQWDEAFTGEYTLVGLITEMSSPLETEKSFRVE